MNNDILYLVLCIVIFLIIAGILFFWFKSSAKPLNVKDNPLYEGIYSAARLNERCSDGTGPNITPTVLLPGFQVPPPCQEGFRCVKIDSSNDPYGYCKAELGTVCNTIYDCAPIGSALGPTGQIILGEVFCNQVCSTRFFGNALEACDKNMFLCDSSQNLICNNVQKQPDGTCFTKYLQPCDTDADCLGGVCFEKNLGPSVPTQKLCYCPGENIPVNTQICMKLDGESCKYDQECYGGVCFTSFENGQGICQSQYLPGKYCDVDISRSEYCLDGYACNFFGTELLGICQPTTTTPTGTFVPNNGEIGALCTTYNVFSAITPSGPTGPTSIQPILLCDSKKNLACNYDFTTRVPVGFDPLNYLEGFGTCQVQRAKIGQPCDKNTACVEPGICIQDNNGNGICSRPQYFDENDSLTIYINNPTTENFINNPPHNGSILSAYPQIISGGYDTMLVQLVGGGGGGNYASPGMTGYYGGGGGGSGKIIGYIGAEPSATGATGGVNYYYQQTNNSNLNPIPYILNLNSFDWTDIQLSLGAGGVGGISPFSATQGNPSSINFLNGISTALAISATGGSPGGLPTTFPTIINNGIGGTGYNGGGAAAGGYSQTSQALGGRGDVIFGGENGSNSIANKQGAELSGDGGGRGAGRGGGNKTLKIFGSSDGGGGGAGSCVFAKDGNGTIIRTGGDGSSAIVKNDNSIVLLSPKSGMDYTGGGGGGGSATVGPLLINGANGGKGYAILRFLKLNKNINYAGQENPTIRIPSSGSSGKCSIGYEPNGLYQITGVTGFTGANFCIPKQNYTCNTYNPHFTSGTLCMNSANTSASGNCDSTNYKIGIFIPTPPTLNSNPDIPVSNYFGKWHFITLPEQGNPQNQVNPKSCLSVYQVPDNVDVFYPKTRVIYHPFNDTYFLGPASKSNYFYYTEFSTKGISPNNPDNTLNLDVFWYKITIAPSSGTHTLNAVCDIKFTSAGNIAMILNETAPINFPFLPGNPGGLPVLEPYNRIYVCDITTDLVLSSTTGTLTYPASSNGPMFCNQGSYPNGDQGFYNQTIAPAFSTMVFNDSALLPYSEWVWDVDDLINKSVAVCFLQTPGIPYTNFFIYSAQYTTSPNDITNFTSVYSGPVGIVGGKFVNLPKTIKYYSYALGSVNPQQRYMWNALSSDARNNQISVYIPSIAAVKSFYLEENTEELVIQSNFNRLIDLEFFDFYYGVIGDQYKYTTVSYNPISTNFTTQELQLDGYLPTMITASYSGQMVFKFMGLGNLDRSMYMLVQTCQ